MLNYKIKNKHTNKKNLHFAGVDTQSHVSFSDSHSHFSTWLPSNPEKLPLKLQKRRKEIQRVQNKLTSHWLKLPAFFSVPAVF